jgi:hypothetical protein
LVICAYDYAQWLADGYWSPITLWRWLRLSPATASTTLNDGMLFVLHLPIAVHALAIGFVLLVVAPLRMDGD